MDTITWTRTRVGTGTKFTTQNGQVLVQRAYWTRPGFRKLANQGSGWVVLVNGKQHGAAFTTATKAMQHAELPGVWADIQKELTS